MPYICITRVISIGVLCTLILNLTSDMNNILYTTIYLRGEIKEKIYFLPSTYFPPFHSFSIIFHHLSFISKKKKPKNVRQNYF